MALIQYEEWNASEKSLDIVRRANSVCREYAAQGYDLTLRQLYYQFVARGWLANNQRNYKSLGATIDKARRAGLMDWGYIVDRTRNLRGLTTYDQPAGIVEEMEQDYHVDLWEGQDYRVEVWVEKEALAGVIQRAALSRGVNYFSCRGYVSQSEMHAAARRHARYERGGQDVVVIHLGDHDPSGIDMSRDMQDRLELFGAHTELRRIALNRDQIDRYAPPPNPAKLTDSRAGGYIAAHGSSSWELDALNPDTLATLITDEIDSLLDVGMYEERVAYRDEGRAQLALVGEHWDDVAAYVETLR